MLPSTTASLPRRTSRRSKYKSARSVAPAALHVASIGKWTRLKILLVVGGAVVMGIFTLTPIFLMERIQKHQDNNNNASSHVGTHNLLRNSQYVKRTWREEVTETISDLWHQYLRQPPIHEDEHEDFHVEVGADAGERDDNKMDAHEVHDREDTAEEEEEEADKSPSEQAEAASEGESGGVSSSCDQTDSRGYSVCARGVSGLPLSQTPALLGAKRGHLSCGKGVAVSSDLVYWNDPEGTQDEHFSSPFSISKHRHALRFFSFEPDPGGWNNVRMSMENIFILAAATGRTLILPPKLPLYLLGMGTEGARSFGNFYDLELISKRVNMITMVEFLKQHGQDLLGLSDEQVQELLPIADICVYKEGNSKHCDLLYTHFRSRGFQPPVEAAKNCLVFDEDVFHSGSTENLAPDLEHRVEKFCGEKRKAVYYTDELHDPPLMHWQASSLDYRLLNHFYSFLFFTNTVTDNHYKRFVRDFLHYTSEIYCAAAKIVSELGQFSSLHIRRGDFQYKEVKLAAEDWYNNTKELWKPGEVLYISTDERNKTWFDPIAAHHPIKFLDDYWDMAGLDKMDPTFLGMIDTIIASHGRAFAGTWFSTFSGYINRLRGYAGKSMKDSWYSFLDRKTTVQDWQYPHGNYHAREWHIGWTGIDGDEIVEQEGSVGGTLKGAEEGASAVSGATSTMKIPKVALSDLPQDTAFRTKGMARGVAGRPMEETPGLEGGSRAHVECDVNVDSLVYWNDPQGDKDDQFESPFAVRDGTKYISFTSDRGGWNNIRMSMEIIFVIAAASGRTLVLPPPQNLYLLHHDKSNRHRGFADFFPLHTAKFQARVPVITFAEFAKREGMADGRLPIPMDKRQAVLDAADHCDKRKKSSASCAPVEEYLASVGTNPGFRAHDSCVVFDEDVYEGRNVSPDHKQSAIDFCGTRKVTYWDKKIQEPILLHFHGGEKEYRLLTHFYNMLLFTNPAIDHYYKRFVRDFLHYHDSIYCAAGKIVKALQLEGKSRGFEVDEEGGGGFSAMHIRRGDFQYKKVKLPAEQWYANTQEIWKPNEILYIATDERNKTWFDPIAEHHTLRFLDDYWDFAGLKDLDPNYMGMIDTIVASRARAFAGTWFSTFTGYINRMRGYHGMTMKDSWYSFLERKTAVHEWKPVPKFAYAWEWPSGWVGIDADVWPSKDKF